MFCVLCFALSLLPLWIALSFSYALLGQTPILKQSNYDSSHRYLFTLSPWKTYVFPSAVLKIVSTEGSEHKFLSLLVSAGSSLIKASSASQSTCRCHSNVARLLSIQRLDGPHIFAVKDQRAAYIERLHKWRHDRVPDVGMGETQRMPNLVDKSLKERKQLKFQCNASQT